MKYIYLILIFSLIYSCNDPGNREITRNESNIKAKEYFEHDLKIIKIDIDSFYEKTYDVQTAIYELEQITNIEFTGQCGPFGKYEPTKTDYDNWSRWFENNKDYLLRDSINQKILIKRQNK